MLADVSLHDIAPRLARARDQLVVEYVRAREKRRKHASREMHLLWLVDHRDLQLARALYTGNGDYIAKRERMLQAAREELANHRAA